MSYTHDTTSKAITQSASTTDNDFSGAASLSGVDKRDVNNNGVRPAFNYEIDGANTTRLQINGTQTIDPLVERLSFVNQPRDPTNTDGTGRTNTGSLHNNADNSKIKVGNGGVLKVGLTTYPDDFQPALTNATWLTTDSNWADASANATAIYIEDGGRLEYNYGAIYCDLSILRIKSSASGYMKNALIVANMESNPITLSRTTSILVESNNFEFDNCRFFGVRIDTKTAAVTLSNVGLKYGQGLILRQAQANVREHSQITCSTTNNRDFYCTNSATTYHCRNTSIGLVGMRIGGSGTMRVRHGVDFAAKDSLGNGINGLTVICNDNQGTLYSVNLDSNGESTAETLITLGLATSSGQTFYSDNSDDVFTFKCFKYGKSIATVALTLNGLDNQIGNFTMFDDALITESNKTTVDAYPVTISILSNTINVTGNNATVQNLTSAQLYDLLASYLNDNWGTYNEFIVTRSGNQINATGYNVNFSYINYTGDMVTDEVIALSNGSIFDGVRTDANGTVYPPIDITFTDIKEGSQLVVYLTGTTTEKFRTNNSSTIERWTEAYVSDITYDVTIIKAGFFPIRLIGLVASTSARFRSINQLIDRAYQASSGLTYSINANLNINTKEFSVSVATTVQNYYSFWIEQWISNSALRNVEFPISTFGGNSFSFDGGYEFTSSSLQYLSRDGFRYFSNNSVTARYAAILSQGVVVGAQPEYQQLQNGSVTDAQNTGNVDQVIQIYGDATHGNFDYTNYLKFKVQANGYRQAEADIVSVFGTLEEQFYVTSLNTLQIPNFTIGNPQVTGLSITDNSSNPVSWDAGDGTLRNYSLTITDTNNNSGEDILRWLNYNLSLDVIFEGKEPFYYPEMVIDNGSSYETIRGVLYGTVSNTLAGVRVIDGNEDAHRDFVRFQSDNGSYGIPVEIKTGSVTQIAQGSRLRIYNITTSQQVFNDIVLGTSYTEEYEEGNNYSQGDQLEIRVSKIDKLEFKRVVIVGGDGWSQLVDQEDNNVYIEYGKDGSTVSGITWDSGNMQFDFFDSNNEIEGADIAAWYFYFITTYTGIAEAFEAISWPQINRVVNRASVSPITFDNIKTNPLIIKNCWINRDDGVSIIASSSNSIQIDPPAVFTSNIDDVEQILENTEKIQKKTKLIPASL